RRFGEHLCSETVFQRRQGVVFLTRTFEWISARLDLAFEVAGFAGNGEGVFEFLVIRFKFFVGDAPILKRHIRRNERLSKMSFIERPGALVFVWKPAPAHAVPVDGGSADPF